MTFNQFCEGRSPGHIPRDHSGHCHPALPAIHALTGSVCSKIGSHPER